jgi:hypothetical protein
LNTPQSNTLIITKASGQQAFFSEEKLVRSLSRTGASDETIAMIVAKLVPQLYEGISSRRIYQTAFKLLRESSRPLAARYHLKTAIMELGPSGFPFEIFIAEVLKQQGYQVQVGVVVQGKCVAHELDVIAEKGNDHFMIECKFHNKRGTVSDVKTPLYIKARFDDVKASWVHLPGHETKIHQAWIVTNTRFTEEAIKYGTCAGLILIGWNYPRKGNLQDMIEEHGLYPLTCLTTLTKIEKQLLLDQRVVLCRDLAQDNRLLEQAGVASSRFDAVLLEVNQLSREKQFDETV